MSLVILAAMLLLVLGVQLVIALIRRPRPVGIPRAALSEREPLPQPIAPPGTFIAPSHSWLRFAADGAFNVGIDDLLAGALGTIDAIELPETGTRVERGDPFIGLRVGGRRLAVLAPAGGEIVGRNASAVNAPQHVTSDPYGLGWLLRLQPTDHKQALDPLHIGRGANGFLKAEYRRLVDLISSAISPEAAHLADGGYLEQGALSKLSAASFEAFEQQFLR